MTRTQRILVAVASLALVVGSATAQQAGTNRSPVDLRPVLGASFGAANRLPANSRFAVAPIFAPTPSDIPVADPRANEASLDAIRASLAQGVRNRGPGLTLMVLGGAAMITGLLIDEPVITVVGAVGWLTGLYFYVR
ncbi:MAG: hypothetical protein SGI84_10040 [Gemmatimonadota bacterium]|nr:hypothetical protein [Gemmatimonadota bacterium]